MFLRFRLQLIFYALLIDESISYKTGITLDGKVDLSGRLSPNSGWKASKTFGYYDTCHQTELMATFFSGDYDFFLTKGSLLGERFPTGLLPDTVLSRALPDTVGLDIILLRTCLWCQFGAQTVTCGQSCCRNACPGEQGNGTAGVLNNNDQRGSKSPTLPSPTAFPSPTAISKHRCTPTSICIRSAACHSTARAGESSFWRHRE